MIYTLLLMFYGLSHDGQTQTIEGFQSYNDCNTAYQEILKRKPDTGFRGITGLCIEVKDVR